MMMPSKRVIIGMVEVGYGHRGPAIVLKKALTERYGAAVTVQVLDMVHAVGALKDDSRLKKSWDFSLQFPALVRLSYALMEGLYPLSLSILPLALRDFFTRVAAYLVHQQPDLVIATHPMVLQAVSWAREKTGLSFSVVALVVDPFNAYSLWADPRADLFLVHSEMARGDLIKKGIESRRIMVVPYPLLPAMRGSEKGREVLRHGLQVGEEGRPVVLVTSGAQGLGRVYSFVERCYCSALPIDFLVVTGKNERLYQHFTTLQDRREGVPRGLLVPFGNVSFMEDLYEACDVVAGKAGAATVMEVLYHGRPFVCVEWVAQNDYRILQFLEHHGLGWYAPSYSSFIDAIHRKEHFIKKTSLLFSNSGILDALAPLLEKES